MPAFLTHGRGHAPGEFSFLASTVLQIGLYFVIWFWARHELGQLPYTTYRVANVELRLQLRTRLVAAVSLAARESVWCVLPPPVDALPAPAVFGFAVQR